MVEEVSKDSHKVVTRKVVLSHVTPRQWHGLWLPSSQSSSSMSPFSNPFLRSSNEATACVNTHNCNSYMTTMSINYYLNQKISESNWRWIILGGLSAPKVAGKFSTQMILQHGISTTYFPAHMAPHHGCRLNLSILKPLVHEIREFLYTTFPHSIWYRESSF